ncbi:MAG: hypothetical protein Q8P50_18750 [Bacillota bacterium]|nr:hypothetical protein [Bacillota bacterium]
MVRYLVLVALASLVLSVSSVAATPQDDPPPVNVPVVLDGVYYGPEEFNSINRQLYGKVDLMFVLMRDEPFRAFTTVEAYNEFMSERGLSLYESPESHAATSSGGAVEGRTGGDGIESVCQGSTTYWSWNYEHSDCGGEWLAVAPNTSIADLRNPCSGCGGWNDRISSLEVATDISREVLYEHISYGGATLSVDYGFTISDLGPWGWNDRASSLQTY